MKNKEKQKNSVRKYSFLKAVLPILEASFILIVADNLYEVYRHNEVIDWMPIIILGLVTLEMLIISLYEKKGNKKKKG